MGLLCQLKQRLGSDPEILRGLGHFSRPKDQLAFVLVMKELRKRHPKVIVSQIKQVYDLQSVDNIVSMKLRAWQFNGDGCDGCSRELHAQCHFRAIRLFGVLPRRSMPTKVIIRGDDLTVDVPIEGLSRWICAY